MSYEARALANATLDLADELGLALTHMALHKVLYHAHGWSLAAARQPLVADPFEAWEFGPVLPTLYRALKQCGNKVVRTRAERFDPARQVSYVVTQDLPFSDEKLLRDTLRTYGQFHAFELSRRTHCQGGAWDQTWNAPKSTVNLGMRISNEAIRAEFLTRPRAVSESSGSGESRLDN